MYSTLHRITICKQVVVVVGWLVVKIYTYYECTTAYHTSSSTVAYQVISYMSIITIIIIDGVIR